MKRFLPTSDIFKYVFVAVATVIVVCSWMFTNTLVKGLEAEERRKMEIWAHATQQFISADENTDIDFVSSIIEGNTTIPVYMTDTLDNVLFVRNVAGASSDSISYNEAIQRLKQLGHRIEVNVNGETVQYIYYDDSSLLRNSKMTLCALLFVTCLLSVCQSLVVKYPSETTYTHIRLKIGSVFMCRNASF